MVCRFHQRVFDLLGQPPPESPRPELTQWEQTNQVTLPDSFREWYLLGGAAIMQQFNQNDKICQPDEFRIHDWKGDRILEFMLENQACCAWGILLDESEDPPAVVSDDAGWQNATRWDLCCDHFSDFVFAWVFDWQYLNVVFHSDSADWFIDTDKLSAELVEKLRKEFSETVTTFDWPDVFKRRFFRDKQRIVLLEPFGSPYTNGVQWWLLGETDKDRGNLAKVVKGILSECGIAYRG